MVFVEEDKIKCPIAVRRKYLCNGHKQGTDSFYKRNCVVATDDNQKQHLISSVLTNAFVVYLNFAPQLAHIR